MWLETLVKDEHRLFSIGTHYNPPARSGFMRGVAVQTSPDKNSHRFAKKGAWGAMACVIRLERKRADDGR